MIRSSTRSTRLRPATALMLIAGLAACDGDSPEPAGPAGSGSAVTLESNELDAGSTGIVVSDGFAGLALEPAVDDDGAVIPDRWTNLRISVGGTETDIRRLDHRTMEFDVPILPGGTYGVDVASPFAHGSASVRVSGVIASEQVIDCPLIFPSIVALVPIGDALLFDTECLARGTLEPLRQGVGLTWPAAPERGFEWLPEGEVPGPGPWVSTGPSHRPNHFVARRSAASDTPEFWVWEGGSNPRPVEPLDCLGTVEVSETFVAPAEAGDGACLLIDPQRQSLLRDGEPLAEWPGFVTSHFVASDDGWLTARNASRLVVFDPAGELVVSEDGFEHISDARFAPGGGPLYVATGQALASPDETGLFVVDRATGEVLRETAVTGNVLAIAASEARLWIARRTGPFLGGELFLELLDPETLDVRRSIAVAGDLATGHSLWPYHGPVPVLLEDTTGTRLTYTGSPEDFLGVWSHVVDVGETE